MSYPYRVRVSKAVERTVSSRDEVKRKLKVDPIQVTKVFNRVTGPLSALLVLALAINLGNLALMQVVSRLVAKFRSPA